MLKRIGWLTTMALLVTATACGDDDGTGTNGDSLVGTWVATSALFTSVAEPTVTADPVVDGDASLVLEIRSDDSITVTTTSGGVPDVGTGTIEVDGSMVTLTVGGDVSTGTIDLDGDRLEIFLMDNTTFDFGSGDEDATLRLTLTRS